MVKKLFLMVVLLATTAFTVIVGEDFDTFLSDLGLLVVNPTAIVEVTSTSVFTNTATVTSTEQSTSVPVSTATPSATLENTATATATIQASTATITNTPTRTLTSTATSTNTATSTPTETPVVELFTVQTGSPVFAANFVHPTEACAWQGIAGQVFGADGSPLLNYIIKVTGKYNGKDFTQLGLTGLVANDPYGPGNFEIVLGTIPVESSNLLTIQLFDPTGLEVTNPITISTYASCSKNLEIINFIHK